MCLLFLFYIHWYLPFVLTSLVPMFSSTCASATSHCAGILFPHPLHSQGQTTYKHDSYGVNQSCARDGLGLRSIRIHWGVIRFGKGKIDLPKYCLFALLYFIMYISVSNHIWDTIHTMRQAPSMIQQLFCLVLPLGYNLLPEHTLLPHADLLNVSTITNSGCVKFSWLA